MAGLLKAIMHHVLDEPRERRNEAAARYERIVQAAEVIAASSRPATAKRALQIACHRSDDLTCACAGLNFQYLDEDCRKAMCRALKELLRYESIGHP